MQKKVEPVEMEAGLAVRNAELAEKLARLAVMWTVYCLLTDAWQLVVGLAKNKNRPVNTCSYMRSTVSKLQYNSLAEKPYELPCLPFTQINHNLCECAKL